MSARQEKKWRKIRRRRDKLLAYKPRLPDGFRFFSNTYDYETRFYICVIRNSDASSCEGWFPFRDTSPVTIDRWVDNALLVFNQIDRKFAAYSACVHADLPQ